MDVIHQLFKGTQAKLVSNKNNIDQLLSLDKTKPAKKKILQECKENEVAEY